MSGPSGIGDRIWPQYARYMQRPILAVTPSQTVLRAIFAASVFALKKRCAGVTAVPEPLGGVPALRLTPAGTQPGAGRLLYLHGGGFTIGGPMTHQHMVGYLAKAAGCTAWLLDYRLAPQNPYPAAPEDTLAAYRALCAEGPVIVAGDSAGGCLALGLLHWAARADLPPPAALVLLSPIGDLDLEGGGFQTRLDTEMLIPAAWGVRALRAYLAGHDPHNPYASPLAAPLPSAPPTLIQYARGEALSSDAERAADALRAAGGTPEVQLYDGVPHVWQMHAGRSRAADRALAEVATFLKTQGVV